MMVTKANAIMLEKRRKVSMYILPLPAVCMRILFLYTRTSQLGLTSLSSNWDYPLAPGEAAASLSAAQYEAALSETVSGPVQCRPWG